MAQRGRKPKPHRLKVLHGTASGTAPGVELPIAEDGTPPNWLTDADALEAWDRLYTLLSGSRVMTVGDMDGLAQLCALQGKVIMTYRAGATPASSTIQQLRTFYNEFGLTPASRGRVKSVGKGEAGNAFLKLTKGA